MGVSSAIKARIRNKELRGKGKIKIPPSVILNLRVRRSFMRRWNSGSKTLGNRR